MVLEVKYGEFTFPLKILNVDHKNPLEIIKENFKGGYGAIHIIPITGTQVALKSIKYVEDIKDKQVLNTNKEAEKVKFD